MLGSWEPGRSLVVHGWRGARTKKVRSEGGAAVGRHPANPAGGGLTWIKQGMLRTEGSRSQH